MFTRRFLDNVIRKALRKKVWFSALDRVERSILSLTAKCVDVVRSSQLGVVIVKILSKLQKSMRSGFIIRVETFGVLEARRLVEVAKGWGNELADGWLGMDFSWYLTALMMNSRYFPMVANGSG
jgi:hypothetical protein